MYQLRPRILFSLSLGLATLIGTAAISGCHSNTPGTTAASIPDNSGPDPADANMAPVNGGQSQSAAPAQVLNARYQSTPEQSQEQYGPPGQSANDQNYDYNAPNYDGDDQVDAGQQALEEADQPPPPLPEYEQPEAPGPNYLWTPGYWGWANDGYYWVPGVWCAPPYYGALWTPPYWGFYGGRYILHRGYWGRHIGFYGGINYGFGYTGRGYEGGYWRGNNFYYNRAVNRVNTANIPNVYNRAVNNNNHTRVSYNGGRGGVANRPQAAEVAAMRAQRTPAMASQVQVRQQASQNRAQFYSQNKGRPATAAAARPIPADRGVQRPNPAAQARPGQLSNRPGQPQAQPHAQSQTRPGVEARPGQPQNHPGQPENRPGQTQARPAQPQVRPGQPQTRPGQPQAQQIRPQPQQARPQPQQARPQPQQARPQPQQARPQPQQARPQPQQARPQPQQARPQPQQIRPQPQQVRPQPQQARPQPQQFHPQPQQARPQPQQAHPQPQQARPQPQTRPASGAQARDEHPR